MSARKDTLARDMLKKREAFEKSEAETKRLKSLFMDAQEALWEHMDEIGETTSNMDLGPGFGEVQLQKRRTVRGNVKNHQKAVESIKAAGLEGELLADPRIPQKALNEHMRDWLASGQAIPEGLDFSATHYISVTRK